MARSSGNLVAQSVHDHVNFLIKESDKVESLLVLSYIHQLNSDLNSEKLDYDSFKKKKPMSKLTQKHRDFLNNNILPAFFRIMFEFTGDASLRISCGVFEFYSLDEIINNYCNNKIQNILDIGYQYSGMGYYTALAINKLNKNTLFFRRDGGSNGYDQIAHFNYYKKYCNENLNKFSSHFKTVEEIIKIIKEKKVDFFDMDMVYTPELNNLDTV